MPVPNVPTKLVLISGTVLLLQNRKGRHVLRDVHMATVAEKTAFTAFRRIVSELRKADKSFGRQSPQFKYLMDQMRDHQVTQRVYSKAPEEAEHVANLYTTYLSSTRALTQLESRYSRGERSVEESARLVGLALPKTKY